MTRSVQIVERMRWMAALAGAAILALAVVVVLGASSGQLQAASAGSASSSAGSSAPLDPRIATLAAHHPASVIQAIVQFNAPVSQTKAQADAAHARGRVIGKLPIIHGLALQMTAAQAQSLAASPDVHSVSLNATVTTAEPAPQLSCSDDAGQPERFERTTPDDL